MISPDRWALSGWGGGNRATSLVYRPRTTDQVAEAITDARSRGLTLTARGSGLSYGDAALNQGGAVLDMTGLDTIHEMDAVAGRIRAGAGATIRDVWRASLPHGWWPPVVPGTMKVTLGGGVAVNIHGKNHGRAGALGRHVESLVLVTGEGEVVRVPADAASAGSGAASGLRLSDVIGAQGLTGTVLEVTLRLHRVRSGFLRVHGWATRSLAETLEAVDQGSRDADYSVAWVDCASRAAGRGVLHHAWHVDEGDEMAGRGLEVEAQALPGRLGGVVPASQGWKVLRPFMSRIGIGTLNEGKYRASSLRGRTRHFQTHAAFHFLLDYIPDWQRAYGRHGLLQYQMFLPAETAREGFAEALDAQRKAGVPSYLGVVKRHLEEPDSAAPYCMDGFSLAMDFPMGRGADYTRLMRLLGLLGKILAHNGGRLYAAKDAVGVGQLPELRDPAFSSNLVRRWERAAH